MEGNFIDVNEKNSKVEEKTDNKNSHLRNMEEVDVFWRKVGKDWMGIFL